MHTQARDVRAVLVGGRVVVRDGSLTRFDADPAERELAAQLAATPYPSEAPRLVEPLLPHIESHYETWDMPELVPYITYSSMR
jgi:hypothetical protein